MQKIMAPTAMPNQGASRHSNAAVASLYRNFSQLETHGKGVIRQADFCRVLVLQRFGGVYLDMDVLCTRGSLKKTEEAQ